MWEIEFQPTAQDLAEGKYNSVRIVSPDKIIEYDKGQKARVKEAKGLSPYEDPSKYIAKREPIDPELALLTAKSSLLAPERLLENVSIESNRDFNADSGELGPEKVGDEIAFEKFDLKLFRYPRESNLDWRILQSANLILNRSYYGPPMPDYDPCRTWYQDL